MPSVALCGSNVEESTRQALEVCCDAARRTVGVIAIVSIVYSIRRFWRADHSKRWHYTIFGTIIICFLIYLTIVDTIDYLA